MNAKLCDVCLTESKVTIAPWSLRVKRGAEAITIAICAGHKDAVRGQGYDKLVNVAYNANLTYWRLAGEGKTAAVPQGETK